LTPGSESPEEYYSEELSEETTEPPLDNPDEPQPKETGENLVKLFNSTATKPNKFKNSYKNIKA
jgi:hypothetical protein